MPLRRTSLSGDPGAWIEPFPGAGIFLNDRYIGMQKIFYTMHFRSQTSQASDRSGVLRTTGSATGCVVSTMIRPHGLQSDIQASDGDLAFFESELRAIGPNEYEENGNITIGDESEHVLRFSTVGQGHLAQGLEPGTMAGTANWKVEGGRGQFAAARGFITSTFEITDSGERSDYHCGLILLP